LNFLLDTCVISELVKPKPSRGVIEWITSCHEQNLFLSALTIGEIQRGVSKLPESRKKKDLQSWLDHELVHRFGGRIVPIDARVSQMWGRIQAESESHGIKMPVIDCLIASTAIVHDMTVATRNVDDMKPSGVKLFNPWDGPPFS
jgi:predicted nucleic acid-binding protein